MWRQVTSSRRNSLVAVVALLAGLAVPIVAVVVASGEGVPFAPGHLFAAVGDGTIKHFDGSGQLVDTLDGDHSGEGGAIAFDAAARLYAANFTANAVTRFGETGSRLGDFGGTYDSHPEGLVRDYLGNIYVGLNDGLRSLLKLDREGNVVAAFSPAVENRGIDWMDLDADQCTLYYTSEGRLIKRFDVCADEQLEDFAALPIEGDNRTDPTSSAYALRIRHNGEVIVATSAQVFRLAPSGTVLQTYALPNTGQLLTLNLDADLTSFWTGDHLTGSVVKVDITSGQTLLSLHAAPEPEAVLGGFAVFGEFLRTEPLLHLTSSGSVVTGQEVILTASLLNVVEAGGREVTFRVTGANPQEATVTTDDSGNALFRYRASNPGTDTIVAEGSSGRPLASLRSNASVAVVPAPATRLVYSGATSGVAGQPATLAARLTDSTTNEPLAEAMLRLGLQDGAQCEATTDPTGLGACRIVPEGPPGPRTVTAAFDGTATAAPSSDTATFTLGSTGVPLATALAYTGASSGLQGEPVTLSARLLESASGKPVAGAPVAFAVDQTDTCGSTTDGNGIATCQTRLTRPPGNHPVTVRTEGDAGHGPASTSAQLLVTVPSGPVQGGRAVVLWVAGDLLGNRTIADTGEVATDGTTSVPVTVLSFPGPVFTGAVADASVATSPGSAQAVASLASLTVDLLPPVTSGLSITARGIVAGARSSCAEGSTGDMRLGFLSVGPVVLVANEITVPPNTKLAVPESALLPPISVTLNEQRVATTRAGNNLTVNALRIVVGDLLEIIVSSVRSDVHRCSATGASGVS